MGLRPDRAEPREPDVGDDLLTVHAEAEAHANVDGFDHVKFPRETGRMIISALCLIAALAWIGFVVWAEALRWLATPPEALRIAMTISLASPPLAVLGVIYWLAARGGRAEAARFALTAGQLRAEQFRLAETLAHVESKLATGKASIVDTGSALAALGEDIAQRMSTVAAAMRNEGETIGAVSQALRTSAATARADISVLLADLPKARLESSKMTAQLEAAGLAARDAANALDTQLATLAQRGNEAHDIAGIATRKLADALSQIESVSDSAGGRLTHVSAAMTQSVEEALNHATRASEVARRGVEAQSAAIVALVDQARAALAMTGAESGEAIAARISDAHERVEAVGALLAIESETTVRLLDTLRDGLDGLDDRFERLGATSETRGMRVADTLGSLSTHTTTLTAALEVGAARADTLIGRTEKLMTALDGAAHEVDEALPAAFDRLGVRADAAHLIIASVAPAVTTIEHSASAALDRLMEAETLIADQRALLDDIGRAAETRVASNREAARALTRELATAENAAQALAESVNTNLVDAMIRVRETAQTAADRAREAIMRVIPEAAAQLTDAARDALARTITDQVDIHIAELGTTAEKALAAAHRASDRLTRKMLTIAETSAAVEARIEKANAAAAQHDEDNFARRVALLIESLNSTAIDVSKILSADVTDSAWAGYLRGDRGIFTRRAVKLLDHAESREIVRQYENDLGFRDQVNRYIHDFEAMLRNTLATRDGSPLSVTLLSSDIGKLYVALAQAIERLRA